ncbi:hypothetical protein H0H81_004558 [Sphagnurus paluster]|uniref:non-specific serine/threonine protein kinase n=1 Tax=Sphagnurus paluster TaxID=117069 RepID=A0A9P7FSE8_9AGAR|nr:hypothetical protein H0H81_004558 [Sphagnurus paluster]
MNNHASLQIPSQDSPAGPRPVSVAVQPGPPPSSSRRQQRASHQVVSNAQSNQPRDEAPTYTDVYSHPAAVAYATAHPRRTIPKFGPYLLLQTLGEGEFGKVKLGLHSQWGEEVAVKLIRRGNVDNAVRMSKVEREIEVLRTLKHPNIVRLYDVIETDKYIGIILEYASGGELFDHILAHRYLRERDAAKLFSQLISGVWYIHQKKIVHRDLKLENLLLDRHRNVIITDFGFANRFEHRADDLMQTSCGSPCYAAPELVISEGLYVGSAVDIWSCGVILYAMLAGYLPFDDDPANPDGDNINLLYKYIVNTPLSFPEYISAEARDLLGMMLVPDPTRRSTLDAVMRHPWLAAHAGTNGTTAIDGVPTAFGRTVDQLERAALEQHQQRRLAYQRQMRAAAQQHQNSQQQQAQEHSQAAAVGRTHSHHIHPTASTGGPGTQHHQRGSAAAEHHVGRSQSTQPEFLYDSSVDLSMAASPSPQRPPVQTIVDDDPFGPPPPASAGKGKAPVVESAKGHKTNGGGSGGAGGFRHTIQVEYDEPRNGHGRSGSGGRRSEDKRPHEPTTPQPQPQSQSPVPRQPQNSGPPPAAPKERRPSQGSISAPASKPLPSPPPVTTNTAIQSSPPTTAASTSPSSFRGLPTPPAQAPATPKNKHQRTPSTPIQLQTPNISVDAVSQPSTPIVFSSHANDSMVERGRSRASPEKLQSSKISPSHGQPTQESARSASNVSVVLSPPAEDKEKEREREKDKEQQKEKDKEGKKSRRNTLTVMVEPFRSRNRKGRMASSGGDQSSAASMNSGSTNGRDKSKSPQPPQSALPGGSLTGSMKSSAGPPPSAYPGTPNEMGVTEPGAGLQASTSKARKVMAWFRSKSKVREGGADEEEPPEATRSVTPTQAEYTSPTERTAPKLVLQTPALQTPRTSSVQRTPSTATADTSFTTTTGTPSLVSRFRNSVSIGGGAHRERNNHERNTSATSPPPSASATSAHPWGTLRTHHGAVDQSTITTKPPPDVIRHVRAVLEGMGVEIQVESEYKYRCVRPKKRKGSMALGSASTPPATTLERGGGSLAAVTMVGSAASNGVDKRGLPVPSPSSFTAPGGMLRGLLMRRQSSQVSATGTGGLTSPIDDELGIPLPMVTEPGVTVYGDPTQDAGDDVKFSVELTRIDRLNDTFSLDIRRMKGNLRSYKFLYDTLRERADLQR